ncbi:lysine methyltransferase SMYD2 [Seminavis robusta]|uniref:Lysine methyltransferase SMYD2 n=1 Tax=Seminavis robusta TaxID=568900 RepID=A0A9N8EN64_9STRA|nr:lysine methyltransferase SMYD2 [Seminavis robusta]|eukprot:Sro1452_g273930.1 lysine methyltransferase SMYD2 (464) ;mRNA; r:20589-21980
MKSIVEWSDSVEVVGQVPNRKVVAKRKIQRGETILKETPVSTLLHPKQWSLRCNHCFCKPENNNNNNNNNNKLLRCSQCRRFWYCGKKCQQRDWKAHKEECTALSQDKQEEQQPESSSFYHCLADALLVARVFRLSKTNPVQFQRVKDLVFHEKCIQPSHYEIAKLVLSLNLLSPDLIDTTTTTTTMMIVELLARFDSNNFGIVDDLLFFLGAGVYPAGAILNHSCEPNCGIFYQSSTSSNNKNLQIIKCLVTVERGQELCHCYVDLSGTSPERRDKLYRTYGFSCDCIRCQDPTGKWARADQVLTTTTTLDQDMVQTIIQNTERLLQQAAVTDDIAQEVNLVQQCVQARAKVLHPRHLALYKARSQLHTTLMAAGELSLATEQCAEMVETMTQCFYPPYHPMLAVMMYTLGSLHHSQNDLQKAIDCYETALPAMEAYHGKYHSLPKGCRDYLEQAKQEMMAI